MSSVWDVIELAQNKNFYHMIDIEDIKLYEQEAKGDHGLIIAGLDCYCGDIPETAYQFLLIENSLELFLEVFCNEHMRRCLPDDSLNEVEGNIINLINNAKDLTKALNNYRNNKYFNKILTKFPQKMIDNAEKILKEEKVDQKKKNSEIKDRMKRNNDLIKLLEYCQVYNDEVREILKRLDSGMNPEQILIKKNLKIVFSQEDGCTS